MLRKVISSLFRIKTKLSDYSVQKNVLFAGV